MFQSKLKSFWRLIIPVLLTLFFLSLLAPKMRRAPWYEQLLWNAMSPPVSVFSWLKERTVQFWRGYIYLVDVSKENHRLKNQVNLLKQEELVFREIVAQNHRLTDLLGLKNQWWPEGSAAHVMTFDPREEFKSLRINKGYEEGIQVEDVVTSSRGLVGKVGSVFKNSSLVLLIADPASHVDVIVQRSRVRCLLSGLGEFRSLGLGHSVLLSQLEYLDKRSDVQVGDVLVTSGLDQAFPKGIQVGTIENVENNRYGIFVNARVRPSVDFVRLEEVMILKRHD